MGTLVLPDYNVFKEASREAKSAATPIVPQVLIAAASKLSAVFRFFNFCILEER